MPIFVDNVDNLVYNSIFCEFKRFFMWITFHSIPQHLFMKFDVFGNFVHIFQIDLFFILFQFARNDFKLSFVARLKYFRNYSGQVEAHAAETART